MLRPHTAVKLHTIDGGGLRPAHARCVNGAHTNKSPQPAILINQPTNQSISISLRGWGRGDTNTGVPGVENGVKALEECLVADKLKPRDVFFHVLHDEVDAVLLAAGDIRC
jgi:hypothetical protein